MVTTLFAASIAVLVLFAQDGHAQSIETDFSGRWVLVSPQSPNPLEPDTLEVSAANEILVTQTKAAITIEHPSKRATHPASGTFEFGSGGFVGDGVGPGEGRWGTTFFGTQLMMSRSITKVGSGGETTVAHGSFWMIDARGRLVIEFREERTRERPKVATRVYVRKR